MSYKYRDADEALLASLGYKQELKRVFTPLETFGITFNIMGILPSIASVLIYAIPNGGPVAMVWGWTVASSFIFLVGLSMAELASAAPTSGGLYFWTHSLASPRWKNLLAWIVGYANTLAYISGISSINWACAVHITAVAAIGSNGSFSATTAQTFGIFVAIVLSQAVLGCLGAHILARLQGLYVVLNIALCSAVIIGLPAATPSEHKNSASYALGGFTNFNGWPDGYAFILSFLAPLWTVCAFDSSVHISEEVSNAAIVVPWAIVSAIGVAGVLGVAINMSLAFCMGTDLEAIIDSPIGQPMAQIFFQSFGRSGTLGIWCLVVVIQYTMGSSVVLSASRQTFAFARDGALPFSSILYRVNSYTGTPVNAVWFVCTWGIILTLLVFAGPQAVGAVFTVGIVALYVAYSIPIASRFVFKNDYKPGPFNLGIFSVPIAVLAVLFMTFMGIVFLFPTTPQTSAAEMNYTVVVLGGVMLLCLTYFYFPKYGGKYWFTGPVATIRQETQGKRVERNESAGTDVDLAYVASH